MHRDLWESPESTEMIAVNSTRRIENLAHSLVSVAKKISEQSPSPISHYSSKVAAVVYICGLHIEGDDSK
jgi:hypothetical protein